MAILFTQADGSDQHYDTYDEFEQAFVLLKRLNGEEVPQDLLDEVSAKYGVKETKTIQMDIDDTELGESIRKATEEFFKGFVEISKGRTPISDACENPEKPPKFEIGDKVRVVSNLNGGHPAGTVGVIKSVDYDCDTFEYGVKSEHGSPYNFTLYHYDRELESSKDSPTEFRTGDIVKVTETFVDSYGDILHVGDLHRFGKLSSGRVCISAVFVDGDNIDKLQLVCRKEDRKDIEL